MKSVSDEFKSHLQGEVITLCRCWILETVGGEKLGFTDHDEDLSFLGVLCARSSGVEAGSADASVGINVNSAEFSGAIQSEKITEADVAAGVYDNARVTTYLVNWSDPDQHALDHVSLVGEIGRRDGFYSVEMRGLTAILDQTRGNHFTKRCQADLGDPRCKLAIEDPVYKGTGTIGALLSQETLVASGLVGYAPGWFSNGKLTWLTGANQGQSIDISEHAVYGTQIRLTLWSSTPRVMAVGDVFNVWAGCDKSFNTCKTRFSNTENFRGFPHLPGNDQIFGQAPQSGKFNGEPLVP